jgi:hypothetical protein
MPIDGPGIDAKVAAGFARAAAVAGFDYDLYRPTDPLNPLRLIDRIDTVKAVFDAQPALKFTTPGLHSASTRYAIIDSALVQQGDYLVSDTETLFVAAKPPFYSAVCILCTATVSLRRLGAPAGFGAIADRSDAATGETLIFSGWPASVLFAGRGRTGADDLPGDMPSPEYMILLPPVPGIEVPRPGDVIVDDAGRRMAVGWQETSPLGWRIIGRLMTAG